MHVNVLHRHLLLAFTPMPIQSIEQHSVRARQLVGLVQVLTSALDRQRRLGIVLSDHTDEDGATIFRQACRPGALPRLHRVSHPKTAGGLIDQDTIPVVGRGPADESQPTLKVFWIKRQASRLGSPLRLLLLGMDR
jgi:hypothetical protein